MFPISVILTSGNYTSIGLSDIYRPTSETSSSVECGAFLVQYLKQKLKKITVLHCTSAVQSKFISPVAIVVQFVQL